MSAKVILVIETYLTHRGKGELEDPYRIVIQYWSLDGVLLAEVDPCSPESMRKDKLK